MKSKPVTHIKDLLHDPKNARKHTPRNVGTIVSALQEVGAARSIVIDEDGVVLAGNATMDAAAEAGITSVKVVEANGNELVAVRRTGLTPEQKTRLALYDNRAAELADWDTDVLRQLAMDNQLDGLFNAEELAELVGDLAEAQMMGDPDEVPEPPVNPITQPGDLWLLGDHRLLCGDSTKEDDLKRAMHGALADVCFTDPPYDLDAHEQVRVAFACSASIIISGCGPEYARLSSAPNARFWYEVISLRQMPRSMPRWPGPFVMHWQNAFLTTGNAHVFHRRNARGRFGNGDFFPSVRGPYKCGENEHGHSKPVEWATELISMCEPAQIIADPFCGSGTTLIAAEQLGRTCYAIEISPQFCDVIVKRWEQLTGKTATRKTVQA